MTDDRIEALVSAALERVRGQLQQELGTLADSLRAHTTAERDDAARVARTEAEAAATALASEAIAAERAALGEQLTAARDAARQQALTEAQASERAADLARAERLLGSVRSLDAATSLSETLEALTAAAAAASGRAAVLVVRGDDLRGWSQAGFADLEDPRALVVPLAESGLLGKAVSEATLVSSAAADGSHAVQPPAPLAVPDRALGVAAPLVVDGRVVAVVYADDGGGPEHEVPSAWPEHVELLARHASRCLEALTARQAVRPRPRLAATSRPEDAESARRYARLLVSEIKLYHEAQVDEGRRAGDLGSRLADQIARARELYEQRVPAAVPSRADLFEQELVRTLADGDARLLGRAS
jgi:hypothetical protein